MISERLEAENNKRQGQITKKSINKQIPSTGKLYHISMPYISYTSTCYTSSLHIHMYST